jgi:hypothetical protein
MPSKKSMAPTTKSKKISPAKKQVNSSAKKTK